jgi:transposase-like protein
MALIIADGQQGKSKLITEGGAFKMAGKGSKGRKSKYEELNIENRLPEIEGWARDGYRIADICKALGISAQTFHNWVNDERYEDFAEAVRKGKEVVDAEIENKLLDNARGFTFWEETQELLEVIDNNTGRRKKEMVTTKRVLKHIKPDTTAQIFWLKNRKPDVWRDKQHMEHSGGINGLDYLSDEDLQKEIKKLKDNG